MRHVLKKFMQNTEDTRRGLNLSHGLNKANLVEERGSAEACNAGPISENVSEPYSPLSDGPSFSSLHDELLSKLDVRINCILISFKYQIHSDLGM